MDTTLLWQKVLSEMETRVSKAHFFTLFKNTALLTLEDSIATIAAPSTMISDMLQKRFQGDIKVILDRETKEDIDILFLIKSVPSSIPDDKESPLFETSVPDPLEKPKPLAHGHLPRVRPDFTFDNFAVSGSNQLAFVSAQTVAGNLGKAYNPLFLYGPVGVGKTHLMNAIANDSYQRQPDKKIIYITSEEFTNEVIEAIRDHSTSKMKKRFRSAILLLIDDIQFIEGKMVVQEELFHTFNILIDAGAQICLSSDRPPHEIKRLEKRLSSRFAAGLSVDIQTPDIELKTAIILKKSEKFGHVLPMDVATLLAEKVQDARSLEGLLLRLITQATTFNEAITLELAKRVLGGIHEEKKGNLHAEDIIKGVCEFYQVKPTQLKGPKRDASLVRARQIAMYLLKTELKLTLVEIGNLLGGRDHTTIMHGVGKMESLVDNKSQVTEDIMGITRTLRG